MTTQSITLQVFRYKRGDLNPRYDSFQVKADRWTTILTALQEIRRSMDSSLAVRHSCHHASCGTCGMIVNGREVLACVTNALEENGAQGEIVIEPLKSAPLMTDLVVDMTPFYKKYVATGMNYIRQSEYLPEAELPDGISAFTRYENCLECGLCVSACPITGRESAYLGPAALAAANRVLEEPRQTDPATIPALVDHHQGCWRCHIAYECSEVCPSNVDPAGAIMALRGKMIKRKVGRFFGAGD